MNSQRKNKAKERQIKILQIMSDGKLHTRAELGDVLRMHKTLALSSMTALLKVKQVEVVSTTYPDKTRVLGAFCEGRGRKNVNLYRITPAGLDMLAAIET